MKILWLSHLVPYPPKGGVLQRSFNLLAEAAKYNEIHLVAFVQRSLMESQFSSMEVALQESRRELEKLCSSVKFIDIDSESTKLKKLKLIAGSFFSTKTYTVSWLFSKSFARAVSAVCAKHTFDTTYFGTISLHAYKPYIRSKTSVMDHHNIESHMLFRRADQETNFLKKIYFRWEAFKLEKYERKSCPQHSLNITCSDLDKIRLQNLLPGLNVVEIPNGVNNSYFSPENLGQKQGLVFAGGLTWYPNLDAMKRFLIDIWPLIVEKKPETLMTVIGRGSAKVIDDIAEKDKRVKVTGFVDDVRPYLNGAAVYVCPIKDGGGTKLKILDAMAMQMAIVADPIACEGIDVKDGISVALASTPEMFAKKTIELLEDRAAADRLGVNAKSLALAKYDYVQIGRKFQDSIESLTEA